LSKDYARYHKVEVVKQGFFPNINLSIQQEVDLEADDVDLPDDYGWKQVHGDVFRSPAYPLIFSSMIGTGYHIVATLFITTALATVSEFYTERGSLLSATIFVYALCTPVNGFAGGGMYKRVNGVYWIKQMVCWRLSHRYN
jgi:transmembrane 9 superfamily protein 3